MVLVILTSLTGCVPNVAGYGATVVVLAMCGAASISFGSKKSGIFYVVSAGSVASVTPMFVGVLGGTV